MALLVHKYGGTSVANMDRIRNVAAHLREVCRHGNQVVVVVSAMGQQTNELIAMARQLSADPPKRELDMLLSVGERTAMALLTIAAKEAGLNAVSFTGSQSGILTDANHTNARITRVTGERILKSLESNNVVIVAGFQGVNPETKDITTLGRGGSDLTAVALAISLKADACEIYTDVLGLCTADPKIVAEAKVIPDLTWRAASEMAWAGAKVIHSRAAHLGAKYEVPIRKRSSFHLDEPGTLIKGKSMLESAIVYAVVQKDALSLVEIQSMNFPSLAGDLMNWLWQQGIAANTQQGCMDKNGLWTNQMLLPSLSIDGLKKLVQSSEAKSTLNVVADNLASVTVVGDGFLQHPELVRDILAVGMPRSIYYTYNNHAIIFAVSSAEMNTVVQDLHKRFIESNI